MILTTAQICQILAVGGSVTLDASAWTIPQLKVMATQAGKSKTSITIKNVSGITVLQLVDLASVAPGLFSVDFT